MSGKDRLVAIKKILVNDKKVIVTELSQRFSVTEETIRRDLEKLELQGIAIRTYGGAIFNNEEEISNIPFYKRAEHNLEAKQQIALKAKKYLAKKSTISSDSSTTTIEMLKLLKDRSDLTIITNSTEALKELMSSNVNIMSTGGFFNKETLSLQGTLAEQAITNYNIDIAVISCKGLDMVKGITDSNEEETKVKKQMIMHSAEVVLLVDSSKFYKKAFVNLIDIKYITTIITDKKPSDEWLEYIKNIGISIIY